MGTVNIKNLIGGNITINTTQTDPEISKLKSQYGSIFVNLTTEPELIHQGEE